MRYDVNDKKRFQNADITKPDDYITGPFFSDDYITLRILRKKPFLMEHRVWTVFFAGESTAQQRFLIGDRPIRLEARGPRLSSEHVRSGLERKRFRRQKTNFS